MDWAVAACFWSPEPAEAIIMIPPTMIRTKRIIPAKVREFLTIMLTKVVSFL